MHCSARLSFIDLVYDEVCVSEFGFLQRFHRSSRSRLDRSICSTTLDRSSSISCPKTGGQSGSSSFGLQHGRYRFVPLCVLPEFFLPESAVSSGLYAMQRAPVPEAPVNEDCDVLRQENYVRLAYHRVMQPITQTDRPKAPFGGRVPAWYLCRGYATRKDYVVQASVRPFTFVLCLVRFVMTR